VDVVRVELTDWRL